MGFRTGAFATVWSTESKGNVVKVRISTSKKNKQSGEYETDFSSFVNFVGEAGKKASLLKEKDKIKIGDCDVTNSYDKEKKVTYTNYAIFSYEMADAANTPSTSTKKETSKPTSNNEVDEEDPADKVPF